MQLPLGTAAYGIDLEMPVNYKILDLHVGSKVQAPFGHVKFRVKNSVVSWRVEARYSDIRKIERGSVKLHELRELERKFYDKR